MKIKYLLITLIVFSIMIGCGIANTDFRKPFLAKQHFAGGIFHKKSTFKNALAGLNGAKAGLGKYQKA
ncbi:MAG: hypothetical protein DRJ01_14550 [Bacteroidetes bacterium]|nr:MAG: hypothetical protein DRJ01_14550 [Bacteroidota bacterium]